MVEVIAWVLIGLCLVGITRGDNMPPPPPFKW